MKAKCIEFVTDLNAEEIFYIFKDYEKIAFLDSALKIKELGEFSIIGINPFFSIEGKEDNIYEILRAKLEEYNTNLNINIPFNGGCIGYLTYDYGMLDENIKSNSKNNIDIPNYIYLFYDNFFVFDHVNNKNYIIGCGQLEDANVSIEKLIEEINKNKVQTLEFIQNNDVNFKSNFKKDEYINAVSKTKEYIKSGDIYIMNLTQRFETTTNKDGKDIYMHLRDINPAPFAAYINYNDFEIISSSPERFIKVENNKIKTRPIKGTRPRGKTVKEDQKNKLELINSEKDKSELLMIVDLERNDLSKVCKPHSVKVTELFKIEEYSTVFHLVSQVEGNLKDNMDSINALKASFPGGSITGTPKIRAMEIIDELEKLKRGLYTGAIGYFSYNGNCDFNIVIRTILKKDKHISFGVGGGITYESIEEDEYEETLHKANALMGVIK